jgi:hypothetical protein
VRVRVCACVRSLVRACVSSISDAIAGVTFFHETAPGYFDTFSRAFVSMFRITIGSVDWWYDIFPIVESDGSISIRASTFLISFVILVNWFFFQITIAVMLEICQAANRDKEKKRSEKLIMQKQREKALKNPLDRLLLDLAKEYVSEEDLTKHLNHLFTVSPL